MKSQTTRDKCFTKRARTSLAQLITNVRSTTTSATTRNVSERQIKESLII